MTLTQFSYVVALDTYQNFADAARHCHVTQPTLSTQIKKLEEELGVLLFDRSKKPVIATSIGQRIVRQAKRVLEEAQRIPEMIQVESGLFSGDLNVGIIPTLSPYLLPLFVTRFMEQFPHVNLIIHELMTHQILEKLDKGMLDFGILVSPLPNRELRIDPLFYEAFVVYLSANHPFTQKDSLSLSELDVQEMWLLKEGHCFRNQSMRICAKQSFDQQRHQLKFESGSLETLKRMVDMQHGYTLLPELAVQELDPSRRALLKPFAEPKPVREVSLVTRKDYLKEELLDAFKQTLLAYIPEEMRQSQRGELIRWD
ncbi:LysR substrate-binding domain-containing protein [Pontibacter sp. G13]|uniref:LysR substrate-binding domain-containing protein n=1 Tax=Pontibacter sp. G13 TaxID=3074898 RepID=UPI00288A8EBD|nr:LysR substrate-binding domain-containing protein [Pontibacter sp. G13]WNJ16845.1 LysR substrate-binding domain-containing protein [Pontibacter sp. G13]